MKVKLAKPCRVLVLCGEVEVDDLEAKRLEMLGVLAKEAKTEKPIEKVEEKKPTQKKKK